MANVKNFGLVGVGSDLQFGKAGTRLVNNLGVFNFKAADGTTDVALTSAGITSSAGNVTLTTGDVVLTSTAGVVSIGGNNMLQAATGGYPQLSGTASVLIPTGATASRPGTGVAGMVRVNNDTPAASYVEFYNGTTWATLATGGSTGALQTEIDNIETSLGGAINTDGTFNAGGFTNTASLTDPTSFTNAIQQIANFATSKDTLDEIFPSTGIANVIYAGAGNTWLQAAPGATSGVQGYSAKLASLASNVTNGIIVQDAAGTVAARSLVAPAEGITITNADGVAGNPTFALADDLAALEGLTTTGFAVRTAADTWTTRSITGTAGRVTVSNGDGVVTSPTVDLATLTDTATGTFLKIARDTYGRVEGTTAVVAGDITTLVDGTYVNVAGDTMTGNLNMGGSFTVTGLAAPSASTDAATKNYVDNAITGLSWKQAVQTGSGTNVNIANPGGSTIGGYALTTGDRVLLIGQTDPYENGIYVFDTSSTPMVRSLDADTFQELNNASVFVQDGTYVDSGWVQSATLTSITTGATQAWIQFSGSGSYTGGVGIDITGNVISANLGAGIVELPSDEIGLDIVADLAIQLTTTATGGQLTLVLDGSSLSQSAAGLTVATNGVTNDMLVNDFITIDADTGTADALQLGDTFLFVGDSAQGISSVVTAGQVQYTIVDATDTKKGVSSFNSTSFTVTAGDVTLNTVGTDKGGTGLTSFVANEVFYAGSTSTMSQSANFTFDGTSTLGVGGALPLEFDGALGAISATATNSDLVLMPNGTGAVVVGPVGAGLIQSDSGTALTIRGNTTLTLESGTGSTTMLLASGTSTKVTVSGPTAIAYATGLAANDLTNKQYVDDAIATGAAAGSIKAVKIAGISAGTTNIGDAMPAGATVLSVKVVVTAADAGATVSVGKTGSVAEYMTTAENDPSATGIYMAETYVTEASSEQVIATVTTGGTYTIIVEYQVA